MIGKIVAGGIVAIAVLAGAALYYLQVYHYYERVEVAPDEIALTLLEGGTETIPMDQAAAIDAYSSPIRYRACFVTPLSGDSLAGRVVAYPQAEPLNAPGWFDCFDADEIGEALERGTARAFLGTKNFSHGVDRVVAILDDGRGYVWHQVNEEIKK
jgi:hypothetical protein